MSTLLVFIIGDIVKPLTSAALCGDYVAYNGETCLDWLLTSNPLMARGRTLLVEDSECGEERWG